MGGGVRYWSCEDNNLIRYIWGDIGLGFLLLLFLNWISSIPPVIERCNLEDPLVRERCKLGNRGGD